MFNLKNTAMKKLLFYFIVALFLGFYSCSSEDAQQNVSFSNIKEIQNKAISDFYGTQTRNNPDFSNVEDEIKESLTKTFEHNFEFAQMNNPYTLLEHHNINPNIIDALIDYDSNFRNKENGFELISEKYSFNEKEIYLLAFSIETLDYFTDAINATTKSSAGKVANCTGAVVSSVITTAGAATITTGWGLGLFLVGKALSLVFIATCAM